ncbi:dihydropteroate synthase [Acetobacter lambici]|uniref:dihydropteroate synthase n=1 Tax=Acetobacter lambici TaxID=1332824 RepID=A0ABT1F152_9PROT|nr:dihydropteroate synthase [Acetobacter lambici]MCP1241793.1 dihydropteroate synthase [Acetobacter lambici]MCP1258009.1 dihydropteroate synthase [Acetobacter lambici]NHO56367.1 dihydropteroate synthase [Acetobacter lambici]
MWRRLVEPMGLLFGQMAQEAIRQGVALPLQNSTAAFTTVLLIEGNTATGPMSVAAVPHGWLPVLQRLVSPVPDAGLPAGPLVMGILNTTPDSFSCAGQHYNAGHAIQAAEQMAHDGAGVLDIGGESTRPGAAVVSPQQEWERVGPVLEGLRQSLPGVPLSVDTRNSLVMERALAAGAGVINDVSALGHDPAALPLLAGQSCGVVLMHMRGTPQTMEAHTQYADVACDVVRELGLRVEAAVAAGIARERLMVDPGFGFAKTQEQNVILLRRVLLLANLGCRVVFALSRKRMIGALTGVADPAGRDSGTVAASLMALPFGNPVLRVHNVASMVQGVRVWQGALGE